MTDNEIKCEKCFHKTVCEKKTCVECNGSYCDECEIYNIYDGKPKIESCESFVDAELINRQQALIEALKAENKQLQSELTIAIQNHEHAKEVLERWQKTTNMATDRAMKAYAELHNAKAKNKALQMDNAQLQSDVINANMNADHAMAENARLRKIAGAMHTWIFLHTGDEEKAYQECGLTDEDNAMLGYIGKIELAEQEGDTE